MKFLLNRRVQKWFMPLAGVCVFPLWLTLLRGGTPPTITYVLGALGAVFLLLDRLFKPWELERAERRRQEEEARTQAEDAKDQAE
jgi:hypothetical protein